MVADCLKSEHNLELDPEDIRAAVRRAFLRGLAMEFRQGYSKKEYCLPAEVAKHPNPNINLPNITNPEFTGELEKRVWEVFDKELAGLLPE